MKLKLVIQNQLKNEYIKPLNFIINKLSHKTVYDLWQSIQHKDMFFDENILTASYDKDCNVIDFLDEDNTVIFFVHP